jgi:hypothetical protein
MRITLEVPDNIVNLLGLSEPELARYILESLVLYGYQREALSHKQVGDALGFGYWETEEFLCKNKAYIPYTIEELEQGSTNLRKYLGRE